MKQKIRNMALANAIVVTMAAPTAWATNGMHMEGYGPISTAMGGSSFAYDVGAAAMANNPATLSFQASGSRLDVAIGNLRPDISSTMTAMPSGTPGRTADSSADSFLMPALGWTKRDGNKVYGVGMYAIGGMGTEYAGDNFMSAGTGQKSLSQVGVGRIIAPLSVDVSPKLTVGGSLDFMWGGFDMQMAMPVMADTDNDGVQDSPVPGTFADFSSAFGGQEVMGSASFSPSIGAALQGMIGGGVTAVRFNFDDGGDFSGSAKGTGWGGKLGFVYKVNDALTVGGVYHTTVAMSDYETGNSSAKLEGYAGNVKAGEMSGRIEVKDFDWPAIIGIGLSYQATPAVLLAADVKQIGWSDVMDVFKLRFVADGSNTAMGIQKGDSIDMTMNQKWDDQTVVSLGVAYKANQQWTLRAGANLASNPVPDEYMNPLFPATIENHYTLGFSYQSSPSDSLHASLAIAPEVTQKNSNTLVETSHSQTNLQLMYSHRF